LLAGIVLAMTALGLVGVRLAVGRAETKLRRTMTTASTIVSEGLASGDASRALDSITAELAHLLAADVCVIALPTEDGHLYCGAAYGLENAADSYIRADEGMTGASYTTGEAIIASDVRREPRFVDSGRSIKSAATVPLRYEGRVLGAFDIESSTRTYKEQDLAVLVPLADQIAAVIENLRLRRLAEDQAGAERKERKEVEAITSVILAGVAAGTDLDSALHSMVMEIAATLGWSFVEVILPSDDGQLRTRAAYDPFGVPDTSVAIGRGIAGAVYKSGIARRVPDVSQDPDYVAITSSTRSEMCVPLKAGSRVLGVLNAESSKRNAFSEDDIRLLQALADKMAIVVEQTRLADLEREALERLRNLDQLKDEFVATVSHELRTPLTSIKGSAQTMVARETNLTVEDQRTFLKVIVKQCDRLASLIETLLLVSRLEAGEIRPKNSYVVVRDLIRGVAEEADSGRVMVDVAPASPGTGFVTDSFRVHHIVRNLVENACKYSPPRTPVLVKARIEDEQLVVDVLDNGPGIPSASESVIFERFRRLTGAGTSRVPGTGLGLYIARRFARDLGGDVEVATGGNDGWEGSRFTLRIPEGKLG
jgi:signal transduction histidine kinase